MKRLKNLLKGKSKTANFNIGASILWFLSVLTDTNFIQNNPDLTAIILGIQSLVNVFLRIKTNKDLGDK